ncbi:941_t:CDS:2 [Diversispora eburnea]|uniref:941_t:CDS:1 n=1 Tax=Diversispora eburnea TaxID=1213867 RepID=A0A9N9BBN3_9GLOM|nr:941_t:CDS:2 [Diversispora eburnea]
MYSNPYLHFYPPPPHPPPPKNLTLQTDPRHVLSFREFYQKHFNTHRDFFQFALDPKPFSLWRIESCNFNWQNQPFYKYPYEYNERNRERNWNQYRESREEEEEPYDEENQPYEDYVDYEENKENEEKMQFVLSDEAIAMFRFSELRILKLKENEENGKVEYSSSSPSTTYVTSEPNPAELQPSNLSAKEAREFYGDSYSTIKVMEATLNNIYVKSYEIKQDQNNDNENNEEENMVVYWPVLPLKFT